VNTELEKMQRESAAELPISPLPAQKSASEAIKPTSRTIVLDKPTWPVYYRSDTETDLSIRLFNAGFRHMGRAGLLVRAIWMLSPLGGVTSQEKEDRFELSFSFLRTVDAPTSFQGRPPEESDQHLGNLFTKLQMLATPFTVDATIGLVGSSCLVKIVLIKCNRLMLLDDGKAWITCKKDSWDNVRRHLFEEKIKSDQGLLERAVYESDLSIACTVLGWNRQDVKKDFISFDGFWSYHRAIIALADHEYDSSSIARLAREYPKSVYTRYRFLVVRYTTGRTLLEVLRKTQVD
jgi:hypothetical protein